MARCLRYDLRWIPQSVKRQSANMEVYLGSMVSNWTRNGSRFRILFLVGLLMAMFCRKSREQMRV